MKTHFIHNIILAKRLLLPCTCIILLTLSLLFISLTSVYSFEISSPEGMCAPDLETSQECIDASVKPGDTTKIVQKPEKSSEFPHAKTQKKKADKMEQGGSSDNKENSSAEGFVLYFFWGDGCPHCEEEKLFLDEMKKDYPNMKILDYEVWYNKQNASLLVKMSKAYRIKSSGVPVTFINGNAFLGFSKHSKEEIAESIRKCVADQCIDPAHVVSGKISFEEMKNLPGTRTGVEDMECNTNKSAVYIPWIGNLDASDMSLPVITLVIAGLDSFNPCAFFVLFSLLGLLIHAQSRKKMFLIGSVFIFFSGFIYFLFMAAWLSLFLVMGQVEIITKIAGSIAVIIAVINIKDFFAFKKGVSLTIPDSAKPKLFDRMRKLMKSTSLISILIGTVVLAVAANSYELLCTAGFPMVFTRILTLNNLSTASYYLYLVLYNLIYIIPLSIIVIIFTVTLGRKHLTEWQGRLMKLISGTMMLGLGSVLLFNPAILSNTLISFLLLAGALVISVVIAFLVKKIGYS